MNISKKMIMSFIMALTSVVSMAQPYYHIMKEVDGKLIEDTVYNGMDYNVKIDMVKPKPKDAVGDKITVPCTGRSFYFTNKGNVYYDESKDRFFFEESPLDYPSGTYDRNHCGHFRWGRTIEECIDTETTSVLKFKATNTSFYFANPQNLPKLKEDLGNEEWAVLSYCEWEYVLKNFGSTGWLVDGKPCLLIDTTSGWSLLKAIRKKYGRSSMSWDDFKKYEPQGLVCLPYSGVRKGTSITNLIQAPGQYWSCTPGTSSYDSDAWALLFSSSDWSPWPSNVSTVNRTSTKALRLVILAEDD